MLWFLLHGLFDLARRPRFDQRLPRGVGRLRRGQPRVRRRGGRARRATARSCSCRTTSSRSCPGWCRDARPDLRVAHFTHTPFCGPNSIRVLPDRRRRGDLLRSMAAVPARLPHRAVGATRTAPRPARCSGPTRDRGRRSPRRSDPTPTRSPRSPRHRRRPRRVDRARRRWSATARLILRSRPHRAVEEHRARLRSRSTACSSRTRSGATGSCSSRCSTRRASRCPSTSRYRDEVEQAAAAVNERWAPTRLAPVVARHPRRLPADASPRFERYDVLLVNPMKDGLNLVAKEGPLLQRARRRAAASRPRPARSTSSREAALAVHPYDLEQNAEALHRALADDAAAERDPCRAGLRDAAARHTPRDVAAPRSVDPRPRSSRRSASCVEQRRQPGRPVDHDVGCANRSAGDSSDAHADAHRVRDPAGRRQRRARRTRRGHRRRRPRTRPTALLAHSPATVVPLSTGTGGRSSHAIRPGRTRRGRERAASGGERQAAAGLGGSGAVRQWTVTATRPLRSTSDAGQRPRPASSAACSTASAPTRPRRGSTARATVLPALEAVDARRR